MNRTCRLLFVVPLLAILPCSQIFSADETNGAVAVQTGRYTFSQTTTEILGAEDAEAYATVFPVDEAQEWEVTVPENYDPEKPPGVLVYISPSDKGRMPRMWSQSVASANLIWVAANRSGNKTAVARRIAYVLLALGFIDKKYRVDASRIYLAGFSGGAKVAGLVAAFYPNVFSGAIYIGGAELWDEEDATIDMQVMRNNRYVFVAGSNDFNRPLSRNVFSKYKKRGIENIDFILMNGKGHQLPDKRQLDEAIRFLDGGQ